MSTPVNPSTRLVQSLHALAAAPEEVRQRLGCCNTVREILQQPDTWRDTAAHIRAPGERGLLDAALTPIPDGIVLTGSGSSVYVGECLAPVLQAGLGVPCRAIAAGTLLSDRAGALPGRNGLLVSIARSGDSPESTGVIDATLDAAPGYRHLAVTCNPAGRLATRYRGEPRVRVLLLPEATNDKSLVMTSSFTNLLLAGSALLPGATEAPAADVARALFEGPGDALARWGARNYGAAVFLGSGANWGAAREAALKSLEMSAGQVRVMSETSLGLRHGPMAWLNHPSILVSFLSGDAGARAYESDLLRELTRKGLAAQRIVVGEGIDPVLSGTQGLAVDLPGLYRLPAAQQAMVHVVVGQLLALFHCLMLGQQPDAPSQGVLTRVVEPFAIQGGRA